VLLLEDDPATQLGDPYGFAVDPVDGSFYFADGFAQRVVRFGRDGRLLRIYGRPGSGPGEFRNVAFVFVPGDGRVLAEDVYRVRMLVFDRGSATLAGEIPHASTVSDLLIAGDTLWLAAVSRDLSSSIEVQRPGQPPEHGGPVPAEYFENNAYFGFNPYAYLAPAGDGWLYLAFAGRNEIYRVNPARGGLDTIDVPRRLRRGVPPDIVERMREASLSARAASLSTVADIHALRDGGLAIVHQDLTIEGTMPAAHITAELYHTLLDRAGEAVCVDLPVPVADVAWPRPAFLGDTLFVLDRRMRGDTLESWVVIYPLPADCGAVH